MNKTAIVVLSSLLAVVTAQADTFGRLERVRVLGAPGSIEVIAKLDGGAERSSLNAVDVKYFNRDAKTWVRFTIDNGSVLPGSRLTLERPVLKDVKIKQRGGGIEHRPQIAISLCLGRTMLEAELSLSDRSGYTAPLLIGTADLRKLGSVDPAREYTREPDCEAATTEGQAVSLASPPTALSSTAQPAPIAQSANSPFSCDGRQSCSQMNSRAEAEFFIKNCPNTKMDGDNDGIPCENDSRW